MHVDQRARPVPGPKGSIWKVQSIRKDLANHGSVYRQKDQEGIRSVISSVENVAVKKKGRFGSWSMQVPVIGKNYSMENKSN